jgi:hypothetical protein
VIRRRSQFALRVLGMERERCCADAARRRQPGVVGAAWASPAALAGGRRLRFFGGDLGAGYFAGVQPQVQFTPVAPPSSTLPAGLGVALLGCAAPALEAARASPCHRPEIGQRGDALAKTRPALACLLLAGALLSLPPVFELPLFGYLSIALLLIGAIGLMPRWRPSSSAPCKGRGCAQSQQPCAVRTLTWRAWRTPRPGRHRPGGVLSSFSLMVAMAIMVSSFRVSSTTGCCTSCRPTCMRARSPARAPAACAREQDAILALPGVAVDFQRLRSLSLAPDRPNVILLARIATARRKSMVLVGDSLPVPAASGPCGCRRRRPTCTAASRASASSCRWRRPAPILHRRHLARLCAFFRCHPDAAGRLPRPDGRHGRQRRGPVAGQGCHGRAAGSAKPCPSAPAGSVEPSAIRALSLQIFDRSFAVTYLLEAIAIVIGLFGVAATFSAQTGARQEFGMLRHVGVTRRQILSILALEGGALTALGIATGFILGLLISFVLVFIVNPQSFHWTMQLHLPWPLIATVAGALLTAAASRLSSRAARRCPLAHPRRQGGLVMRRVFILSLALALPAAPAPPAFAPVTPLPAGPTLRLPHDFGAHPHTKRNGGTRRAGSRRRWQAAGLPGDLLPQRRGTTRTPSAFAPKQLIIGHAALSDPMGGCCDEKARAKASAWPTPGGRHGRQAGRLAHAAQADGSYQVSLAARDFNLQLTLAPAARAAARRWRLLAQGRAPGASELLLQPAAAGYPRHDRPGGRQAGSRHRHHMARPRVVQRCSTGQRLELDRRQPR